MRGLVILSFSTVKQQPTFASFPNVTNIKVASHQWIITMLSLSSTLPVAAVVLLNGSVAASALWSNIYSGKKTSRKTEDNGKDALCVKSLLKYSMWLSNILGHGVSVNLKMETLQPSGSFQIRGVSAFMKAKYNVNSYIKTFVTTSPGNAGMAVAHVAQQMKCECKVILDENQRDNELIKEFTETYGAEVEFQGEDWKEADEYALKMCNESRTMEYVNMFNDRIIWNGHSSIITELEEQCDSPPDAIVCAVGGGGLLMGVFAGLYRNRWSRDTKVIAAQSENYALFEAARRNSFNPAIKKCVSPNGVDLGYRSMPREVADMVQKFESFNPVKSMVVRDDDVLNTATLFGMKEHVMIEPLCAVTITAMLKNKKYFRQFKNIVVIVDGGNHIYFDLDQLRKAEADGGWNLEDYAENDQVEASTLYSCDDLEEYDSDTEEM